MRDPRRIPEPPWDLRGLIPERAGDLAGIIPETAGDFSGTSDLLPPTQNRGTARRQRQFARCSVSRIPQWYSPAMHGTPMMARAARSRQASSVARQISSVRRINNLQAKEKIFKPSVALQKFTSQVGRVCWKEASGWVRSPAVQQGDIIRSFGDGSVDGECPARPLEFRADDIVRGILLLFRLSF